MLALAVLVVVSAYGLAVSTQTESDGLRADIIHIDTLKMFGPLERPEVVFLHDKHSEALARQDKDCSACHLSEKRFEVIPDTMKEAARRVEQLSSKFQRLKDTSRTEVMNVYHDNCIDCHRQMTSDGIQSGPATCGGCHSKEPPPASSRLPMGFDNGLHYRHSKAYDKKCEQCHHQYDEIKEKLYYEKGKESSCRYCHKDVAEDNRMSMGQASHTQCIRCHIDRLDKEQTAGPIQCAGCHAPEERAKIEPVAEVPRMERNQPDVAIVQTGLMDMNKDGIVGRMDPVPFDHKAHEAKNDNCRVCHHAALDPCVKCHTVSGPGEGEGVNLERAMHLSSSKKSCVGCHADSQADKTCAGCHAARDKGKLTKESCGTCHIQPPEGGVPETGDSVKAAAKEMLAARTPVSGTYASKDIPETVVIDALKNEYEPVRLPHRKIVNTLVAGMEDNKLAAYFHTDPGTICQGCHHNSPVSKQPPRCSHCHSASFDDQQKPNAPGLNGAYHQQCLGCHEEMGLEKPAGCAGCHKKSSER